MMEHTPEHELNDFLSTAVRAAILAGGVILNNLGRISKNDIGTKQVSDFVTHVDRDSERIIIKTIKKRFPHHFFLAEESPSPIPLPQGEGARGRVKDVFLGKYRWIIDPLDGTTNYIHGYPMFSVSIALEYNPPESPHTPLSQRGAGGDFKGGMGGFSGEIILGVIFDPLRDELFTAEKGRGAFLNGHSIKVSSVRTLKNSLITTGFPFRKKEFLDTYLRAFKNILLKVSDLRRAGSAALDLAHLACGRCEGFFEIGLSPWDIAAGSLIIKEAGGVVTDFGGREDYLATGNIVAGTPVVHREILKEVKNVFKGIIER
jgi:myo-inositol-1(or 4)-monophosphatase